LGLKRWALWFTAPRQIEVREEPLPTPAAGQVLARSLVSAISPGTEMLIYRGQFPAGLTTDAAIAALPGALAYPLQYGYATVGEVRALGPGVEAHWLGQRVFAFQPHASHFLAAPETLIPLPPEITPESAVFLPNTETAVNLLHDGAPLLGERVLVIGQGIVGLLTTALLAQFPLAQLLTLDHLAQRRQWSRAFGAHQSLAPDAAWLEALRATHFAGADLVYELSGAPAALDTAIAAAGYSGRIIVGSWYGQNRAPLDLGGRFHRERLRIVSSQVSTIAPELQGRWSKPRRFAVAWQMLQVIQPARLITHRYPLHDAARAYQQIDQCASETIQVVFDHSP
jgi:2-desacetyl-2-hydroxyethyl bacteriochlorophyllide A dehydrogenase